MVTLASETWTGANGAAWPAQWTKAGTVDIQSNQGRMLSSATAYGAGVNAYLTGMTATADVEVTFSFTTPAVSASETLYFGTALRSNGTFTGFAANTGYWLEFSPANVASNSYVALLRGTGTSQGQSLAFVPFAWAVSTTYKARFRAVGSVLRAKVWPASGSEPAAWTLVARDSVHTAAGKLSFSLSAGSAAVARDVRIDDLVIATASDSPYPTGAPMEHWRTAVRAGNATALFIGDSLTEGQGASAKANRWQDLLRSPLRTAAVVAAGGVGYLPAWYACYGPDSPWEPYTSRTGTHTDDAGAYSLGRRAATMTAGATVTYTVTGTSMDVWWIGGGGTLTYAVDGGAATAINTVLAPAGVLQRWPGVSLGASGSHTVVITATAGSPKFAGLTVYNGDSGSGVRFFDAAKTGGYSYDFAGMGQAWSHVDPDLAVIELGANDYLNKTATAAQVKANIQALIADIRLAVTKSLSVAVVVPAPLNDPTALEPWANYVAAITAIATEDTSVKLISWESLGSPPGANFSSDGLHYSNTGQQAVADRMFDALRPGRLVDRWNGTALVRQRIDRWNGTALVEQVATP